ncbi:MAG: GNAT family N-acetyltransferase [Clostridiales bacterium]|jgi:predicted GNAT family N-acyltransferase|nr:GNAT family N-acetyltransferase [Clostridiales bacterium]
MEIYRVEKGEPEWLCRAYDYARTDSFCFGQNIPFEMEFAHDAPREELQAVVMLEDHKPIAGCSITFPRKDTARIGRVCVIREKQRGGYGRLLMADAEKWILESGVRHIVIVSQDRAEAFYHKLGYITNPDVSPREYASPPPKDDSGRPEGGKPEGDKKSAPRIDLGFSVVLVEKYL